LSVFKASSTRTLSLVYTRYLCSKSPNQYRHWMCLEFSHSRAYHIWWLISVFLPHHLEGAVVVVIVSYLDLQLPVQSVPIKITVVSSNPTLAEVYSIQYYLIKKIPGTSVSSPDNTDCRDITEILLKVALNTITLMITQHT
jgi:hypothetical protein